MNELNRNPPGNSPADSPAPLILLGAPICSEMADFVGKAREIFDRYPEILSRIEADQISHGIAKKEIRLEDKRYLASLTGDLPGFSPDQLESSAPSSTVLEDGRPRMPALIVAVFFLLRGWLGGPKSDRFRLVVTESLTLRQLYEECAVNPPGLSTINDNLNTLSLETCDLLLRCQLDYAKVKEFDDFEKVRIDSTAAAANAVYPTDSSLVKAFLGRALVGFQRLKKMAVVDLTTRVCFTESIKLAGEVGTFSQVITMIRGKLGAKEIRKDNYKKIYSRVPRIAKRLGPLAKRASEVSERTTMPPSHRARVEKVIGQIETDLESASRIALYSKRRVIDEEVIGIDEKILSICEGDATIIKKGDRDMVFGYRPQLAFSGKGLVVATRVPEGNAADAGQLETMLELSEANTKTIAKIVTVDDGYLNGKVRENYLKRALQNGITAIFSIAGSKGKKSLGEETFYSEDYHQARCDRSAAESCISTLKGNYGYGEINRRGLEAVRQEQMSKVLAYNIRKLVALENDKRQQEERDRIERSKLKPPDKECAAA